jgi:hypothetical protein
VLSQCLGFGGLTLLLKLLQRVVRLQGIPTPPKPRPMAGFCPHVRNWDAKKLALSFYRSGFEEFYDNLAEAARQGQWAPPLTSHHARAAHPESDMRVTRSQARMRDRGLRLGSMHRLGAPDSVAPFVDKVHRPGFFPERLCRFRTAVSGNAGESFEGRSRWTYLARSANMTRYAEHHASPAMLAQLKADLFWLREEVLAAIRRGDENAAIHQANLIPPELLTGHPDVHLPYLLMREHVIDRLYDQNVGYWQADLQGISHLSRADRAEILVDYLGLSAMQLARALQHMVADGKYELAASLLESSGDNFAQSESGAKFKRLIYLKLMEQYQNTDPFKFILYSAKAGEQTPQMGAGG